MNNQSPFSSQAAFADQKNRARARVKIAVFFVLAVNGVGLMALLMQGCRQEKPADTQEATNATPTEAVSAPDTNPPPATANPPAAIEQQPVAPVVPPPQVTEYTVVQGDTLGAIAKKSHITVKALEEANPGVEPTKLKIGQKLKIPPPATPAATAPAASEAGGDQVYTVKSGDNLLKIAGQFGVSVKAIRAENNLKTDKIVVGQKLKIPAKSGAATAPADSQSVAPAATSTPPAH